MIDWIFPVIASAIAIATPKGQYKNINIVLAALFIIIFGIEEIGASPESPLYDGAWYDCTMITLYVLAAYAFYEFGGRIQTVLACGGVALSFYYGASWILANEAHLIFTKDPENTLYYEVMITLYILQLLASLRGMAWAILSKMTHRCYDDNRTDHIGLWNRFVHWAGF